jgi:pyridoxine 4-dehydrogenase
MIPIPGSSDPERVKSNTRAADIELTDKDLQGINDILANFEVKGGRYPESHSAVLVSHHSLSDFLIPALR